MQDTPHVEGPVVEKFGGGWVLTMRQWLARRPEELFPFFGDAYNLEAITPDTLSFNVLTPRPIAMKPGALIDYKLKVRGFPIRWRTEITQWDPTRGFIDEQLKGPYKRWHHEHRFDAESRYGVEGTLCHDRVEYEVPGGPLAGIANWLLVQRDVEGIFKYRAEALAGLFLEPAVSPVVDAQGQA